MEINKNLPVNRCRDMVNRIPCDDETETLKRCGTAESWLRNNEVITDDEFDALMKIVEDFRSDVWKARKERMLKQLSGFHAEGRKEYPLDVRGYYNQQKKAGITPTSDALTIVERNMLAYGDETIYRDPDGNLWRDYFSIGD